MNDEEIEILDFNNQEQVNAINIDNEKIKGDSMPTKIVKKRRLKKGLVQIIFCLLSFLFMVGCCIFYGSRLIKYYKIYNPKTESGEVIELISNAVIKNTPIVFEGSGIYRENGIYVYKGNEANNYIKFSNLMWRIIRTNVDGSLEIILDDPINALAWDASGSDYIESDVHQYLNEFFIKQLDTNYLAKTTICADKMESINKFTCNEKELDYYVKLLPANDFLNSVVDNGTYVAKDDQLIWLGTFANAEKVWHTNGSNLSSSEGNYTYLVKPVVTIKNSTALISGSGTAEEPYIIEKENDDIAFATYLQLGDDLWTVYEKDDKTVKLVYTTLYNDGLSTYRFDTKENDFNPENNNSLAQLLNTEFYDSLSYKDLLLDFDIYTGLYIDSYQDVYEQKVTAKVGILNVADVKLDYDVQGYYLSTKASDDQIYYYREDLISSKVGLSRVYRPTISIEIPKISSGSGTRIDPFIVEV